MGGPCRQLKRKWVGLGGTSASAGDEESTDGACRQLKRKWVGLGGASASLNSVGDG